MLSTAHLLTGAAIGTVVQNPWQVVLISVILHFVWDSWPHWDPDYNKWKKRDFYLVSSLDMLIGLCLGWWTVGAGMNYLIFLGMFFSVFPDILTMVVILGKIKSLKWYIEWHKKIQNATGLKFGLVFQLMVVIVSVLIVKISVY
jgi:hypothetical protein